MSLTRATGAIHVAVHRHRKVSTLTRRDDGPVPAYKKPSFASRPTDFEHFEGRFQAVAVRVRCRMSAPFLGKAVVIVRSSGPPGRKA